MHIYRRHGSQQGHPQDALSKYSWRTDLDRQEVEDQPQLVTFALEKHWEPVEGSQKEAGALRLLSIRTRPSATGSKSRAAPLLSTLSGPGDSQELQPVGWLCPSPHPFPGLPGKRSLLFAGWFVNTPSFFPSRMKSKKCVCLLF